MPAPAHLRVSVGGEIAGTEVWSNNFALDGRLAAFSDPDEGAELLHDVALAINSIYGDTWATHFDELASSLVNYRSIRVAQILGTGETFAVGEVIREPALTGTGAVTMPPQVAAVVSLRTAVVGASGRGRMYFPALGVGIVSGGVTMNLADRFTLGDGHKIVFDAINDLVFTPDFVGSMNVAVASNAGTGMVNEVTRVQVGNVFDTQRRRRENIIEAYENFDLDAVAARRADRAAARADRRNQVPART